MSRSLLPLPALLLSAGLLGLHRLEPAPPSPAAQAERIRRVLRARGPSADRLPLRAVQHGDRSLPAPTEHWLDPDSERLQKDRRKKWMAERHRAAPGVDWKAIDRDNGRAMVARRNAILRGQASAPELGSWVERGSQNLAGRMHVAVHSTDGSTLYAGSSKGGIWKRPLPLDGEGDWTPIGDNLYGGTHWLLALSGDEGAQEVVLSSTDWGYVTRSVDGGATWEQPPGVGGPWETRRLLVTSEGSETVFLITGLNYRYDLLRSTDRGASFQQIYDLGGYAGDLFTSRTGSDATLYLATSEGLLISTDLGESWQARGPSPGGNGAHLAGSEAGAPTLYAVVDSQTLLRSDDAGASWQEQGPLGEFWGALAASTLDPLIFTWGGVELWRSVDGGQSAEKVNEWWEYYGQEADRLHADIMGIDVVPGEGGETWYASTDGGLYRSVDALETVQNESLDGLRVSQYYDTNTDRATGQIAAGAQDQGYQLSLETGKDDRLDFEQVISGDYAHLVSDGSHDFVFSVYPGFLMVQVGADGDVLGWGDFPSEESGEYYAWLPPLVVDPTDPTAVFFCATHLYRYAWDGGKGWTAERWSDEDFAESAYEFLSAIAFAPSDPSRAYAATSTGRLLASTDGGRTWEESDDTGPDSHYFHGTAMVVHPTRPGTAWVGGSGYGEPAVYKTTDGGETWEDWGQGLPDTLVYDLAWASDDSGRLFAGAESGAFTRAGDDGQWEDITGVAAPITTYWSVEALPDAPVARFGTYGRGIWDFVYTAGDPEPEPEDTGEDGDGGGDGGSAWDGGGESDAGCGCGGGAPLGLAWLLPALLGLARRRVPVRVST